MKNHQLTTNQKRVEALYERELRRIIDQLVRREELPSLPVSYCQVDKNFQTLRVYTTLPGAEGRKLLEITNKRYTLVMARLLAATRKFRRIPRLIFLPDQELEQINRIEELIKSN